jgi:two-component system OmpR family sensor kinase
LGAVAAGVLLVTGPSGQIYFYASASDLAFSFGVAVALVTLLVMVALRRAGRRLARDEASTTAEAVRADRRMFLTRLDHELKNPITAMRAALANVTALVDGSDESVSQALSSVDAQALRLSRLTADLRKIAEVETQALAVGAIEVPQLLEEVKSAVENTSGRSIRLLIHQVPVPVSAAAGDEDLIFLAVHNLVSNAAKFCGPDDNIELRAFNDPPWVVIEVADDGPGIPADELDLVWEELGRARNARGYPGSGLGLALVRTIVTRHGGLVELHSSEGKGTLFAVRLHQAASTQTQRLEIAPR